MKISFTDRCGYKKANQNKPYYFVIQCVFLCSILLFPLVERFAPCFTSLLNMCMTASGVALVVYCLEDMRKEYAADKVVNITSGLYAAFFLFATIALHYLCSCHHS